MDKVRKNIASHQVNNVLNICNWPFSRLIYDLPINSLILIYRNSNTGQSKK